MPSSSNNAIYNTVGASISGVTNTLTITNPSNTASSAARETIIVGGGTASDPTLNFNVSGVTNWEMGIDNSDSDKWKLSQGTALGTNDTVVAFTTGEILKPRQPAFFAYLAASDNNVTGDGTVYTLGTNVALTEVTDQGNNFNTNGTFTAPVTGLYSFQGTALMHDIIAGLSGGYGFVINATLYGCAVLGVGKTFDGGNASYSTAVSIIIPMTAGDTCKFYATASGGGKSIDITGAAGPFVSWFAGFLVC